MGRLPSALCYAHALARSVERDADAPRQPLGAGLGAGVSPALAGIELTNQVQKASACDLEVGGQLGDLVAEAFRFCDLWQRGRGNEHASLLAETVRPDFGRARKARYEAIRHFSRIRRTW